MLSTDKAVYPINAMGISKAMMEKPGMTVGTRVASGSASASVVSLAPPSSGRRSAVPSFQPSQEPTP